VGEDLALQDSPEFRQLTQHTLEILGRMARMLSVRDAETARRIIEFDPQVDRAYKALIQCLLTGRGPGAGAAEGVLTLMHIARAMERMGDLCTNIAEDIIFLRTGDIVRHSGARGQTRA
jgi:phosphate transport system protein